MLVLALLFCGALSLAAQSRSNASVYVAPVTGRGGKPDDNSLFYNQLLYELTDQKVSLANAQRDAEYSLYGSVAPSGGAGQFVFHLALINNKTGAITVEGELLYGTPEDTDQLFSVLVTSLLYTIPAETVQPAPVTAATVPADNTPPEIGKEEPAKTADWRDKWLYLGLAAKWSPRYYVGKDITKDGTIYLGIPPLGGISAELHFLNFMSFEVGAGVAGDKLKADPGKVAYSNLNIEIPLLLKFCLKPGANFMFEPYAGACLSFPISSKVKNTIPDMFSGLAGFQYGVKAGPGAVFIDLNGAIDISGSTVKSATGTKVKPYRRVIVRLGLGYKFGLFQRETK
jgi:hypothetical protein